MQDSEGQLVEGLRRRVDTLEANLEDERAGQATTQRTFAAREAVRCCPQAQRPGPAMCICFVQEQQQQAGPWNSSYSQIPWVS